MRLLLVDDQREITESLKKSIDWAAAGVDEVCTAVSAKEAKLIMVNMEIDILLTILSALHDEGHSYALVRGELLACAKRVCDMVLKL